MQGNVARIGDDGGNKVREVTPITKPVRERSRKHLALVGSEPSIISGKTPVQVHHLTHIQPKARGLKGGDQWTVPITMAEHTELHNFVKRRLLADTELKPASAEAEWWREMGVDPVKHAIRLWAQSHGVSS